MTQLNRTKIKPQIVGHYAGIEIVFTEGAMFKPAGAKAGPLFAEHETFDSVDDTCKAIDERITTANKNQKTKLTLPVITTDGRRVAITGVHMGTGHITGTDGQDCYPYADWIADDIARLRKLRAEVAVIHDRLRAIQIDERRTWGKVEPAQYVYLIEKLLKEHAAKTVLAERGPEAMPAESEKT